MGSPTQRGLLCALLVISCALVMALPCSLQAQGLWTELSTLGYGGVGFALSFAMSGNADYDTFPVVIAASTLVGMIAGNRIGAAAERVGTRGEWPGPARLFGARVSTVAGVGALGAVVSSLVISNTNDFDDEMTLMVLVGAGALLGILLEARIERGLAERISEGSASVFIDRSTFGGLAAGFELTLR